MASNSRPLLLDLRDEDFQRGYIGSRPPSLISPEPKNLLSPAPTTVAAPRSGKGKTIALFVGAIAASVIASRLLSNNSTAEHTTVGVEAVQNVEAPRAEVPPPAPPPPPVAAPVVAEVAKPVVQNAVVVPVAPHPKPIAAAVVPKPVAKAAPATSAEEKPAAESKETKEEPKPAAPATPTFGVEEAGF